MVWKPRNPCDSIRKTTQVTIVLAQWPQNRRQPPQGAGGHYFLTISRESRCKSQTRFLIPLSRVGTNAQWYSVMEVSYDSPTTMSRAMRFPPVTVSYAG